MKVIEMFALGLAENSIGFIDFHKSCMTLPALGA